MSDMHRAFTDRGNAAAFPTTSSKWTPDRPQIIGRASSVDCNDNRTGVPTRDRRNRRTGGSPPQSSSAGVGPRTMHRRPAELSQYAIFGSSWTTDPTGGLRPVPIISISVHRSPRKAATCLPPRVERDPNAPAPWPDSGVRPAMPWTLDRASDPGRSGTAAGPAPLSARPS